MSKLLRQAKYLYNEKTPIDVLRNALVSDKMKEGFNRRVVEEIVDKSIE